MKQTLSKLSRFLSFLGGLIAIAGLSSGSANLVFKFGWGTIVLASGVDIFLCDRRPGEVKNKKLLKIIWIVLLVAYLVVLLR